MDEFFTRTDATGAYTPITDDLGSVLGLADGTGNIVTQYTYDPFGNTTSSGAASSNTSQYTGRENDGNGEFPLVWVSRSASLLSEEQDFWRALRQQFLVSVEEQEKNTAGFHASLTV